MTTAAESVKVSERTLDIDGVVLKELVHYADERGFFMELIRATDPFFGEGFGQLNHLKMYPGIVKAWHVHKTQIDWWYVPLGRLRVALHDTRAQSPTFRRTIELYLGDDYPPAVLKIPAGVAHGCKVIGGITYLFYITSRTYDLMEEGRIPHDDPSIGYDWVSGPAIK